MLLKSNLKELFIEQHDTYLKYIISIPGMYDNKKIYYSVTCEYKLLNNYIIDIDCSSTYSI